MMLLVQLAGTILLFTANLKYMMVGAIILCFGALLDTIDGEIARYRKKITILGNHLDQMEHYFIRPLVYLGLGFSVFKITGLESALIFGFLCSIFSSSVVMTAMNCTLVSCRFAELNNRNIFSLEKEEDTENKENIQKNSIKREGEIPRFKMLYSIARRINFLFTTPYEYILMILLFSIELINSKLNLMLFKESMLIYYLLGIYAFVFVLMQIMSFIIHTKSNTIEIYYKTLFKSK